MRKLAIIGCVTLLLIIIAIGVRYLRPTGGTTTVQSTNLVVTFLGFTNTAGGGHQALFYFTNATPRSLHFQVKSLDYKSESGWESAPETRQNRLLGELGSGTGFSWPVDVDATNTAWRVRISCVEEATGVPRVVDRGKEVVNEVKTGNPTHIFTGRMYEIVSSEARR